MKAHFKALSRLFYLVFMICLVWSFFFAGFVNELKNQTPSTKIADGLVVLTGGSGRIDEGFTLLSKGRGQRLLLSGVNRNLDFETTHRRYFAGVAYELFVLCLRDWPLHPEP